MRRTPLLSVVPFAVAVLVLASAAIAGEMHGKGDIQVKLSAVPKVTTKAGGEATFRLSDDGKSLRYMLKVEGLENATMAHVHEVGADGGPGAIVAWLYPAGGGGPSLKEGTFSGTLSEGDVKAETLAGPLKGKTPKELAEMIGHGKAGVAIHTKQNPGGELWGVRKKGEHKETEHKGKTEEKEKEKEKEKSGSGY